MTNTDNMNTVSIEPTVCGHADPMSINGVVCQLPLGHEYGHWYAKLVTAATLAAAREAQRNQAAARAAQRNPYLYCHECKDWVDAEVEPLHGGFSCKACGEVILCDECGQMWDFTTDHEHAIAKQRKVV